MFVSHHVTKNFSEKSIFTKIVHFVLVVLLADMNLKILNQKLSISDLFFTNLVNESIWLVYFFWFLISGILWHIALMMLYYMVESRLEKYNY